MTLEEEMKIEKQYAYREGRSEGVTQEKREIAKNLKSLSIGFDKIAEATGLSIAEIEAM